MTLLPAALLIASIVPIAPLQPSFGDQPYADVLPRAATDGVTTLAVWDNVGPSPANATDSVYGVFVQPDGTPIASSFRIAENGLAPRVATDGSRYLVAYGVPVDRFATVDLPDARIRTVQRDGTLGPEKTVSTGRSAANVSGLMWSGDHWIVAYADTVAHVAFFTRDLEPFAPAIDFASNSSIALVGSGSRVFAFQSPGPNLDAYEIIGGQTTRLASTPMPAAGLTATATPNGALVIARHSFETLDVLTFSPSTGWSAPNTIDLGTPYDLEPSGASFLLLSGNSRGGGGPLIGTTLDANGAVIATHTLAPSAYSASLLGSLLLLSDGNAILAGGRVISITRTDVQSNPIVVSAGSYAMAFWNQSVDDAGTLRTFSRKVDAAGQPLGDPNQLSFTMGDAPHGAFDGTQFIVSWTGSIVAVSGDGKTAGPVNAIFPPAEIEVAAANGARFAVWTQNQQLSGSPLDANGKPQVPDGFPLLPSIRTQSNAAIGAGPGGFIAVWTEDSDVGAMLLSPQGTPSSVHSIGTESNVHPVVAGDDESALAEWLQAGGSPVLVAFDRTGGSFDLFDPHWGDHFTAIRVASAGVASHFFTGLVKNGALFVGETGQTGSFVTELDPLRLIGPASESFDLTGIQGRAVAIWPAGGRVWIGTPENVRRRAVNH